MRKLLFLLVIFVATFKFFAPTCYANSESFYARILSDGVYLYRSCTQAENYESIYFELEKSYFVEVLDEQDNFYKAKYMGTVGYVLKSQVEKISQVPLNPYPRDITFSIYNSLGTKLRTTPTGTLGETNVIGVIPVTPATLTYIGSIEGEESIRTLGKTWFYCSYSYSGIGNLVGYVYAPLTENLTTIMPNTETFSNIDPNSQSHGTGIASYSSINFGLVLLLCIPALIFIVLLFVPTKSSKKQNNSELPQNVKVFKRTKRNPKLDYYEID